METKEIKINLPIDITTLDEIGNVTATIENGSIVITCEPKKKEFKFGDFVRIQKFLDENNLVVDYDKKEIVHKRWRAEKGNTFYYVSSSGIVLNTEENFWECNNNVYECGNYFRTKEQAEKVAKEVREVFEKHKND